MRNIPETQRTLRRSTSWLTGVALDHLGPAALRFHPAPAESGIVFVREDLPGSPPVRCRPENLRPQHRWSALEQDGIWVHHTEHVLGALGGLGIDNVLIELRGDRVPVVSAGSCAAFCEALLAAGDASCEAPRRDLAIARPLCLEDELPPPPGVSGPPARCELLVLPAETFSITFVFHAPALPRLRAGVGEYHTGDNFTAMLGAARSFDLCDALGSGVADAQGFLRVDERSTQQELHEIARHKALDLLGDLTVLGRPPRGRYVALRGGHRLNQRLVLALSRDGYLSSG